MFQKVSYQVFQDFGSKNGRGECQLKIKAKLNNTSASIPTNIYVCRNQFKDEEVVEHEQAKGLNAMINKYIMELQSIEIDAFRKDIDITIPMLYSMYVEKVTSATPLIEFCDHIMNYGSGRREVTKNRYKTIVKEFERYHPGVCLEDIDIIWLKKFEKTRLNQGVSDSTVWSNMKVLRMLFNEAIKRDLMKPNQNPFRLYEIPEIRSRNDVLMFQQVEEFELMGLRTAAERRVRDIFCFACYTGLRWYDIKQLKSSNITKVGDVTWLKIKTHKTGAFVQIPLSIIFFGNALRILEKYESVEKMVSYALNSSVNRELKPLLDKAGIGGGQRVSMHTARRTCLTGLADFGVPIQTIQKIAGHSRITTTSKYVQLSTGMIQRDLEHAFCEGNANKIVHIDLKRPIMRISVTGKKLFVGSELMRCKNCSFYQKYNCKLFKKRMNNESWCDSFSERLDGEPYRF